MPLIILTGYPASGKTHRATQLSTFLTARIASSSSSSSSAPAVQRLTVHHISDAHLGVSRAAYADARAEKDARAAAMSAIKRVLGRDSVVIADGLNYIKGFRYQLFCEAKAVGTASCVVHIGTPIETCRRQNAPSPQRPDRYADADFDNLVFRYEEPNGMARWDSPLFTVLHDDAAPPCERIWEALMGADGKGRVVKPNLATMLKPATPQNYLYDLDKTTSDVLAQIQTYQAEHVGEEGGGVVQLDGGQKTLRLPDGQPLTLPQLQRIRRQFISLNRQCEVEKGRIGDLFVDYLNDFFERG